MRRLLVVFAIVCISAFVNIKAQEIIVKECNILANDESAVYIPDANGDLCALLKIKTNNIEGLTFPNESQYVGKEKEENGVYYVYIPSIMYKLSFSHKDYMPGTIDLSQFGYKKNIKGGRTYEIILEAPLAKSSDAFVSFKITPYVENCKVIFNNEPKILPETGIVEFKCSPGHYDYTVFAKGYEKYIGNIDVVSGVVPISVNMQSETVIVDVQVNVDASIYIDDVYYGSSGLQRLPQGNHKLRASASGYIDEEQNVLIDEETKVIYFVLKKNKGKTIDVHAVPVIVHCNTSTLYKNNKAIPGWRNGEPIMLIPNTKCKLTSDSGHGAVLKVSDEPMEIEIIGNSIRYLTGTAEKDRERTE